ncbi:MAG: hypothetical protein ACI9P5_001171 [Saprospiraceae bacterium]|jgi:hypothetical protein
MDELLDSFARLFVSREILTHFEVVNLEEDQGVILIELIEKDDAEHIPKSILREGKAVKDGYMNTVELQSFPAQGKEVFLRLKRRRWKIKGTKKGFYNNYNFINTGMKATKEFGSFLKEIGRE